MIFALNEPLGSFLLRGLRNVLFVAELQIRRFLLQRHVSVEICTTTNNFAS